MAANFVIVHDNIDEVIDQLQSAKAQALLEVGIAVQKDARLNSPVRTGALRRSWQVEVHESDSFVEIGVPVGALDGDYAKFVENGTSRTRAHHMLQNAVNDNVGNFPNIIRTELENA